jgi:hypothetical protein
VTTSLFRYKFIFRNVCRSRTAGDRGRFGGKPLYLQPIPLSLHNVAEQRTVVGTRAATVPPDKFIAIAKSLFRIGKPYNPPCPPLKRGETTRNCWKSPPLTKGDLGGFKNLQTEGIYGKRSNPSPGAAVALRVGGVKTGGTAFCHSRAPKQGFSAGCRMVSGYLREGMGASMGGKNDGEKGKGWIGQEV